MILLVAAILQVVGAFILGVVAYTDPTFSMNPWWWGGACVVAVLELVFAIDNFRSRHGRSVSDS